MRASSMGEQPRKARPVAGLTLAAVVLGLALLVPRAPLRQEPAPDAESNATLTVLKLVLVHCFWPRPTRLEDLVDR